MGLIPAHAGSTRPASSRQDHLWAHPRSRGEHHNSIGSVKVCNGSSPLTRGARDRFLCGAVGPGLIPAHAGSTCCSSRRVRPTPAHPRSRGEHINFRKVVHRAAGSSPLTRGAPIAIARRFDSARLIPAHAGSTASPQRPGLLPRAHPRSRGEHWWWIELIRGRRGSSPLTRGARLAGGAGRAAARLIPAHAGSTSEGH